MAIAFVRAAVVSRARGSSAVAAAAYITGEPMLDERTGRRCHYRHSDRIYDYGVLLPEGAQEAWQDAAALMNAIEAADKAKDSAPARKYILALPRELTPEQQKQLVQEYIQHSLTPYGYAAVWALHLDERNHNPHAHLLVPNRPVTKAGKWGAKNVSRYRLDENGERIPVIDPETGKQKLGARNAKQWERDKEPHYLEKRATLDILKAQWAELTNLALERAGREERIDVRSYAEQGLDILPTIHEGHAARKMEEMGKLSERMEINRRIRARNKAQEERKQAEEVLQYIEQINRRTDSVSGSEAGGNLCGDAQAARRDAETRILESRIARGAAEIAAGTAENVFHSSSTEERPSAAERGNPQAQGSDRQPGDSSARWADRGVQGASIRPAEGQAVQGQERRSLLSKLRQYAQSLLQRAGESLRNFAEQIKAAIGGRFDQLCPSAGRTPADRDRDTEGAAGERTGHRPEAAGAGARPAEQAQSSRIRGAGALRRLLSDYRPAERETAQSVSGIHPAAEQLTEKSSALRTQPAGEAEKQDMLREAQEALEQLPLMLFLECPGLIRKKSREKNGETSLQMEDGRTIVIASSGCSWHFQRPGARGRTGVHGGSVLQLLAEFIPGYTKLAWQDRWDVITLDLAQKVYPGIVQTYEQQPKLVAEQYAAVHHAYWQRYQEKIVSRTDQHLAPEQTLPSRDSGWER